MSQNTQRFLDAAKKHRDLAKNLTGDDRQNQIDRAFTSFNCFAREQVELQAKTGWPDKEKIAHLWFLFLESAQMSADEYPVGQSAIQQFGMKAFIPHGMHDAPIVPVRPSLSQQNRSQLLKILAA